MIIQLVGEDTSVKTLETLVNQALSELALTDAVTVKLSNDAAYKMELGITESPALCIEEESIDFRDMIFQGEVPPYEEIKSMFISILGDDEHDHEWGSCGTGGCGDCSSGCH